jgi:hypothetical protein
VPQENADFQALLTLLTRHSVEFVVVGGICAVLHGAPVHTFDLDVVPSRGPGNIARLVAALQELDAWYRERPHDHVAPTADRLAGPGHHLLMTRLGPLDVLGVIGAGEDYDSLASQSREMQIAPDVSVLVLDLEALIRIRTALARDKDKAVLPILRRTLEEQQRHGDP